MITIEIDGQFFEDPYNEFMRYKINEKAKAIIQIYENTFNAMKEHPEVSQITFDLGCLQAMMVAQQTIISNFNGGEIIPIKD